MTAVAAGFSAAGGAEVTVTGVAGSTRGGGDALTSTTGGTDGRVNQSAANPARTRTRPMMRRSFFIRREIFAARSCGYVMKSSPCVTKRPRFGKMVPMSVFETPNQRASVAEYSSTEVVGIQRPVLVSSGPLMASVGKRP